MAINSSISDIPWLGQPADLATSMLKGSQVGSSLVSAYLRARELRDQEERDKALLPLRQQELQAQVANAALDQQIKQEQVATMLRSKAGSAEMWTQISQTDWEKPEDISKLYAIGAKYGAIEPQAMQVITVNTRLSEAAKMKQYEWETRAAMAEAKAAMPQKETALQDAIDNQLADENRILVAQGKPAMTQGEAAQRRAELRANAPILGGGKEATQVFDVNGNLVFSQTKGGGMPQGLTPGLQTDAQKDMLNNRKNFDIAKSLEGLDPSSVGIRGVVGNIVFDRLLGDYFPDLASDKRIDDRTKLITVQKKLAQSIVYSPRATKEDKAEANAALPSPGIIESARDIQQKMRTLQTILKRWTYEDARAQGVPPPYWSMQSQDEVVTMFKKKKSEIQRAVQENKMKAAAANAAILREMADAQEVLEEQYGIPPRPQTPAP